MADKRSQAGKKQHSNLLVLGGSHLNLCLGVHSSIVTCEITSSPASTLQITCNMYIHCTLRIQNVNLHLILVFFLNFTVFMKNLRKRNLSLKHDFI